MNNTKPILVLLAVAALAPLAANLLGAGSAPSAASPNPWIKDAALALSYALGTVLGGLGMAGLFASSGRAARDGVAMSFDRETTRAALLMLAGCALLGGNLLFG